MFHTVIMAGGVGERFWPKSSAKTPKQLLPISGKKTMIQETVNRLGSAKKNTIIITNAIQRKEIVKQLPVLKPSNVVAEPCGRNTAPCIGYAALLVAKKDPEGVMVVLPADHVIADKKDFLNVLKNSVKVASATDALITIGIKPDFPATGYGYIQVGKTLAESDGISFSKVSRFKEKPNLKNACKYVESGKYLWNSGMFVWKAKVILDEIKTHLPKLYKSLKQLDKAIDKKDKKKIASIYEKMEKVSIDYGVMEKAKNVYVTGGDFGWDDVGSWSAVERLRDKDKKGNVKIGNVEVFDTKNCIIWGDKGLITAAGVSDLVIVKQGDAFMVCDKNKDQQVKDIVNILKTDAKYKKYL